MTLRAGLLATALLPAEPCRDAPLPVHFSGQITLTNLAIAVREAGQRSDPADRVLIVSSSPGGAVAGAMKATDLATDLDVKIWIAGSCESACTLLLNSPTTCGMARARLGVHYVTLRGQYSAEGTAFFRSLHPPALRAWADARQAYDFAQVVFAGPSEIRKMGIPRCE